MRADNSHHLVVAARQRRTDSLTRVQAVLDDLERHGGPASVTSVAARAGVSRTFLYDPAQEHLLARLREIAANMHSGSRPPVPAGQRITTASHEQVVRALRERNKRLAEENSELRAELAAALGQVRELRRAQPQPSTANTSPR